MNRFNSLLSTLLGMFLLIVAVTGCFVPFGQRKTTELTVTEAPPPAVQLWQAAKRSNWLVTLSILGIAGSVFAIANGSVKLGTATAAGSGVSLFLVLAVARFALWMAVAGMIAAIAVVLFSILVRRRALMEIIEGVQIIKNISVDPVNAKTILDSTQTKTTKKIVGKIKNELKLKGEI